MMYSHSKRIINPRKDEFYRTDNLPSHSNYYSTSSVYSYSPTSTSDCPEHGRRRKMPCILTAAIVVASLGLLIIISVTTYLGILSKNVSSNASQYEESSYLLSNTNKLDRNSDLIIQNGRSRYDPSSHNNPHSNLDITNSILDTKSTHQDNIRNEDDLTQNIVSNKVLFSQKNSTSTVKKTSSSTNYGQPSQRYPSLSPSPPSLPSLVTTTSIPRLPPAVIVSVSSSSINSHSKDSFQDEGPVIIRAPPTTQPPASNSHDRHRNRYRNRYAPSSPAPTTTPPDIVIRSDTEESTEKPFNSHIGHHEPEDRNPGERTSTEINQYSSQTIQENHSSNHPHHNNDKKKNETMYRHEDIPNEDHHHVGPTPDGVMDRNFDSGLLKNHRGVIMAPPTTMMEENPNSAEYFVPVNPLYTQSPVAPSSPSSSIPTSHSNTPGSPNTVNNNNHRVHLTFDRIAPLYYDKKPWTPILNRPNLDKRPRVELVIPTDTPMTTTIVDSMDSSNHRHQQQSQGSHHHQYEQIGEQTTQVYYPGTGDLDGNEPIHTSADKDHHGMDRERMTTTTRTTTTILTESGRDEEHSQISSNEGGKPPDIPAFTLYIPHITSSNINRNSTQTTVPTSSSHLGTDGQRDNDKITPTSSPTSTKVWNLPLAHETNDNHSVEGIKIGGGKSTEFEDEEEEDADGGKEDDYPDIDDITGEGSPHSNIYKLDADNIDIVPDTLATAKPPLPPPIRDLRKEDEERPQQMVPQDKLSSTQSPIDSHELFEEVPTISNSGEEEEESSESNVKKTNSTDFLVSTLGSLHLMKTADVYETGSDLSQENTEKEKESPNNPDNASKESSGPDGSPLFPPVRSYVGINQPLRPKPTGSGELLDDFKSFLVFENKPDADNNHMQKKFRITTDSEKDHLPDLTLTTTSSLNKVLSMMMNFQQKENTPLANISSQNVHLIVADNGQGIIVRNHSYHQGSGSSSHREPKLFSRDPKIDTRFHEEGSDSMEHVPVPLIKNESQSKPPLTKISSLTVANSPVYKFVLRKGQSVEDLLKEIFHNFTEKASTFDSKNDSKLGETIKVPILRENESLEISTVSSAETENHLTNVRPSTTTARNPVAGPHISHSSTLKGIQQSSTISPLSIRTTFDPPVITSTSVTVNESFEPCPTNNSFRCESNGKCISGFGRCNGIRECPDNSDEKDCLCVDHLRAQMLHRKICDGFIDCIDKSDENQCNWCKPNQYICSGSRTCVDRDKICDGVPNCPKRDDENECVKIGSSGTRDDLEDLTPTYHKTGHLMVRKKGVWGKLCVETFSTVVSHWEVKDLARAVCKALTFSDFETVERVEDEQVNSTEPYYELHYGLNNETESADNSSGHSSESSPRSGLGFKQTPCHSKLVVKVTCQDLQCGTAPRAFIQTARIVGGSNSQPGEWPWQAALYRDGEYQCGATLISSRWLLSAGHCFYHAQDDFWVARLGTLRRGATVLSPYEQVVRITHIFLHPQYKDVGFINDVSLLRLEHEVNFTDFVRPVCLPGRDTKIRDGRLCTVVGWGQLFEVGRVFPDTLQEVQLPLISTAECRKRTLFLPLYKLTDEMFCAGYDRGGRDACLGDSGGGAFVEESDGRWSLYGVTSNGYGCARANRPGVYTKVASYLDWIYSKMSQDKDLTYRDRSSACKGHRCPLGECLESHRMCNGIMDCLDRSDERNCTWS